MVFHDENEYILRTSSGDIDISVLQMLETKVISSPGVKLGFYIKQKKPTL